MSLDNEAFAESVEYQQKVLALMLHNPQFCEIAGSALKDEDFSNKILQWYFDKLCTSKIHLTTTTLKEEMLRAAKGKEISTDLVPNFIDNYKVLASPPVPFEEEYIVTNMHNFIRAQAVKRAVLDSVDLIKTKDWAVIQDKIEQAVNAGADIMSHGLDYFAEHQDRVAHRASREIERKLMTGIPELDQVTYGGLKTKQLGLCVGGTGRGKSIFLQWLARVAILLGKKVVYYTFELSDEDMAERFDSMFARIKPHVLKDHSTQALKRLSKYHSKYGSSLIIKEYPEGEATVHDLKAHLLQLSANGFVPDLVLVDYVDLLKPHRIYNDKTQEQEIIIQALRGLSKSLNTRIWTAAQLNRSGLSMETPDESSIKGAVSKLFTCDISLFMAQTNDEREDEKMRLWISKNRNGKSGRTITLDTDYDFMTFFRPPPITEEPDGKQESSGADSQGNVVSEKSSDEVCILR